MNSEVKQIVEKELDRGERLLWYGMPKQGFLLRGPDAFLIPFSLLWGGFAIFWEFMALTIPKGKDAAVGAVFPIFGIPFVVIGLYCIFGRFVFDAKKRSATYYAVTDQRALIISGVFRRTVQSLHLKALSDVALSERPSGHGSITFGQKSPWMAAVVWGAFPGAGDYGPPRFEQIENARQVYNQIRAGQKI